MVDTVHNSTIMDTPGQISSVIFHTMHLTLELEGLAVYSTYNREMYPLLEYIDFQGSMTNNNIV